MDTLATINNQQLDLFSDDHTKEQIRKYANANFDQVLTQNLLESGKYKSDSVLAKLRDQQASFQGIVQLSGLIQQLLRSESLLTGFLYMAILRAVHQGAQGGGGEDCFRRIIDKLRCVGEQSALFYSRCSDSRVPADHAKQSLSEAYRLQLAFIGAIVEVYNLGPLVNLSDPQWKTIEYHESKCNDHLRSSQSFLDQQIQSFRQPVSSPTTTAHRIPQPRGTYMYPNRGTPRFFGRTDELEQLRESLKIHNSVRLHGIPGVGKTSLALRFANQSESDYNMIFWMECEPSSALDQSCHEALSRLGVIDAKQKPGVELRQRWREFLTQTSSTWLVIFDNVERSQDLEQFWPPGGPGKIIVTARDPELGFWSIDHSIAISPFTSEQGRDCILSLLAYPRRVNSDRDASSDGDAAEALSNELGGLPIGIVQMIALMRAKRIPLKRFLTIYRENALKYHDEEARIDVGINAKRNIGTNWDMSFKALTDEARSLLGILSFLSPDAIPEEMFNHWDDESKSRTTCGLLPYCDTYDDFVEVEYKLFKLALADKEHNTEMLNLHRLEQLQFKKYLDPQARQRAFDHASRLLYDAFPKQYVGQRFTGRWEECGMYIQHAIVLNTHYTQPNPAQKYTAPVEFAKLMGWYLFEVADFSRFQQIHAGGMRAYQEAPKSESDMATLASLNYNAGTVETAMGLFAKAKVSLYEALRIRRSLGVNDDDIAATLNSLGLLHSSVHEFGDAEECYLEARDIHLGRAPSSDRDLSLTMVNHNLQRNAIQRGTTLPTVEELQSTVRTLEKSISWWMTAHAYLVLGNLMLKLRQFEGAEKAYLTSRDMLAKPGRAGKQPAVAMVIYKLGCVEYGRSRYSEAAQHFRDSISISKLYEALPAEQARTQFMLAESLRMGGKCVDSTEESVAREMVTNLMKAYHGLSGNPGHPIRCSTAADFDMFITTKYQ